jgi:hypothetical protein
LKNFWENIMANRICITASLKSVLESIADIEHRQWESWAKNIVKTEKISPERVKRWEKLFVPYGELSEEEKDKDREWARKVIKIVRREKLSSNDPSFNLHPEDRV